MTVPFEDRPAAPRVTFWGAARTVTGSMHLVEAAGRKILLDCGAHRGQRHSPPRRHGTFPFDPASLDAVALSHAHSDHCGNLPHLVRQGFAGPIYCTPATRDLVAVMLTDSARVQEEDAYQRQVVWGGGGDAGFSRDDVRRVVERCVGLPYDEPREILPGLLLRLVDAGHILGSAMVALTFDTPGRTYRLTFTGDLGRRGLPLVRAPSPVPPADLLISESTYGGRTHEPLDSLRATLSNTVRRTAERGGKVLVPAFSLGRSQAVVHALQQEMREGRLPELPVYVDSPLAADVTDVYRRHRESLDAPGLDDSADDRHLLNGPGVRYVRDRDESRALSGSREPCVIVASSGMVEGGRVLHHLRHHVDDPRCTVVLVSYQAPDSIGARLLERRPTVRFLGREWNKWIDVVLLKGFSGHADQGELLAHLRPLAGRARKVRLVHGEVPASEALAGALRGAGFGDVALAERGEPMELMA